MSAFNLDVYLQMLSNVRLIPPYGSELVDLTIPDDSADSLRRHAARLPSLQLSERSTCDLEMLAIGAFSPLDRFMGMRDYQSVLDHMRLGNGQLFPIPITLPIDSDSKIALDQEIALRDARNDLLGVMTIEEIYEWNVVEASQKVFGTLDIRHPLVAEMQNWGKLNISGHLRILSLPRHYDFRNLRLTPAQVREKLESLGRSNVVAFQTRNPLHRPHEEMTKRAIEEIDGALLLHPSVGMTKPGDVDYFTRVRSYLAVARHYYDPGKILLSLLPLAMRFAGPREALWHAIIRRNYGANYLIVGRDHASPGVDCMGKPFYGHYDAQKWLEQYGEEIGINMIPFHELVFLPDEARYEEVTKVAADTRSVSISGTGIREEYLKYGRKLPDWFTRPETADILSEVYPPRHQQGVCIWFTGLSGAGKSTTAEVLQVLLLEQGRRVTILDGDVVRTHLSKGLGFSKTDRDANVLRIGFVASEIVRHGGVAICSAVSPYRTTRDDVRKLVGNENFVEVFVNTPLELCEKRDVKGLYSKARRGEIQHFTGIDDPYESPLQPEITLDTVSHSAEGNAQFILHYLFEQGFLILE
jgi:sulfate adenylyltransferase